MANFGVGNSVPFSFVQSAGFSLDALATANTISEVLSADKGIRYLGMMVFIEDENKYYYFSKHQKPDGTISTGIEDSDFQPFSGSASDSIDIVDDYSKLVVKTKDSLAYTKNDYIDTVTNKVYDSGLYLYTIIDNTWNLVLKKQKELYPNWEANKDYYVGDRFKYNGDFYEVIIDYTSTTVFNDGIDNLIYVLEKYYVLSQQKYDLMVANGLINATNKHLYIVNDATSNTIKLNLTITQNVQRLITSNNGTDYNINADLIVEQIGEETITISKSLDDIILDDGTEIHVGDVLEIYKKIGGVEVYSYNIVPPVIYDPFA